MARRLRLSSILVFLLTTFRTSPLTRCTDSSPPWPKFSPSRHLKSQVAELAVRASASTLDPAVTPVGPVAIQPDAIVPRSLPLANFRTYVVGPLNSRFRRTTRLGFGTCNFSL